MHLLAYGIACVDKETLRVDAIISMNQECQKIHDDNGWSDEDYVLKMQIGWMWKRKQINKNNVDNYLYIKCATSGSLDPSAPREVLDLSIRNKVRLGDYWSPESECFYNRMNRKLLKEYPSWILKQKSGLPHNDLPPVCWADAPIPKPNLRGVEYDWVWVEEAHAWSNDWYRDEGADQLEWIEFYQRQIQSGDLTEEELEQVKAVLESKIVFLAELQEKQAQEEERIQALIDARNGN